MPFNKAQILVLTATEFVDIGYLNVEVPCLHCTIEKCHKANRFRHEKEPRASRGHFGPLTMRLSDAGASPTTNELIYPNHRPLLGSPKMRPRDCSNRLLDSKHLRCRAHLA